MATNLKIQIKKNNAKQSAVK